MSDITPIELRVADVTDDEQRALKALESGTASDYQQRLALYLITNKLSRAQDLLYIPGNTHASAFLNGRAFVGQQILKILNVPVGKLQNEPEEVTGHGSD